jgi:hypothetical protein
MIGTASRALHPVGHWTSPARPSCLQQSTRIHASAGTVGGPGFIFLLSSVLLWQRGCFLRAPGPCKVRAGAGGMGVVLQL